MVVFIIEEILREKKEKEKPVVTKKEMVDDKLKMHPDEPNSAIAILCDCSERYVQQRRKENEVKYDKANSKD